MFYIIQLEKILIKLFGLIDKNMIEYSDLKELKSKSVISDFDKEYHILKDNIDKILSKNTDCVPIFIAVCGSVSYGMDLPASDLDAKCVYIQSINSLMSELKIGEANPLVYKKQLGGKEKGMTSNEKSKEDISMYEIGRFLELVADNNPNIMEMLFSEDDCIVYKHPIWDTIKDKLKANNVLTKKCYYTFFNYANQQINKATGLNKKIKNPVEYIRKTPIDFSYVVFDDDSTMSLRAYLDKNSLDQRICGVSKISHCNGLYSLYYDYNSHNSFSKLVDKDERESNRISKREKGETMGLGYKGIIKENDNNEEVSNDIRVSSIPKDEKFLVRFSYNKDGYMSYCKDYKEYWEWVNTRNEERYKDNTESGRDYDGKNLSHCMRLLYMANEIADNKGLLLRRDEKLRKELLSIKKGEPTYDEIIFKVQNLTEGLKEKYDNSVLPESVSYDVLSKILLEARKSFIEKED